MDSEVAAIKLADKEHRDLLADLPDNEVSFSRICNCTHLYGLHSPFDFCTICDCEAFVDGRIERAS